MDICPCISKVALINYLVKYITKGEIKSKDFDEIMKVIFQRTNDCK